jgi:hypothetical protein
MNYKILLDNISNTFETYINTIPLNTAVIPTDDFGWYNARFQSELFRLAHVERYSDSKIEVLHVTTFPHQWSPEPIFGFDVICTDNKVVGAYMDLSPGLITYPFDDGMAFEERKPLPDWATVFSERFILLKPNSDEEFIRFVDWTYNTYRWYLTQLAQKITGNEANIIRIQNNYCQVQASNPRTYSVLKSKIGESRAKYFMEHILFPQINFTEE